MKYNYYKIFFSFTLLSLLLISTGCNNEYIEDIDRGLGYNYRPGHPELRAAASGQIREDNTPVIIVSGDLVKGSLIYTDNGTSSYEANFTVEILVREASDNSSPYKKRVIEDRIQAQNTSITNNQDVYRFEEIFEVEPGKYEIQIIVTDQKSNKRSLQTLQTEIPDPSDQISHITEIRVLGKNTSNEQAPFNQATTYDIPSRIDSLKFVFQVTNSKPDAPIEITSRLLKFRSDTSIARPMSFNNYSSSSIQYLGIDYNKYDVIQQSSRILEQTGSVIIELSFSDLPRGNYRLEVRSETDEDNELFKARDFGIKSENYPSLKTPEELARPLYYLMDDKEYEELMSHEDPKELKNAIDRFWLSNVQNSNMAKNVISQYYQRVEEANKQFSNFKEGWKTDTGMIYILFGPPLYNDHFSDQMLWSYSYNQEDPERNFLFVQPKLKNEFYPFYHFILQRSSYYHTIYYRQTERWRSGTILSTNL
ncbi:GWxTD domain-containing protein [Gracilimonas tropica]|uniref:GWxTD domain-containing protein n=1 Tax=Gracilimonas tropica TaxID=454600 RepID=UPI00036FA09D|nr:GWxTD domain-containing protein [Gracilimonas tropica]